MIKTKEITDELIKRSQTGDKEAYRQIYLLYNRAMFNISLRITANKTEAEDVLQESFISAFQNIGQFKGKSAFGAWLKKIIINRSIDVVKKRNVNLLPLNENDDFLDEPVEEFKHDFSVEQIIHCIKDLPDGYRIILSLYLFENHSHKMIAEKLNISEGTSKSQYARARKKLAQLLTDIKQSHE